MKHGHHSYWRRCSVFDPMNAHSQADEPPLLYVMEFNASEREFQQDEDVRKALEEFEARLQEQHYGQG